MLAVFGHDGTHRTNALAQLDRLDRREPLRVDHGQRAAVFQTARTRATHRGETQSTADAAPPSPT